MSRVLASSCARSIFRVASRTVRYVCAAAVPADRRLLVAHILVPEDKASVLDDCEAKLKEGAAFSELAKSFSECQSKAKGGELGWLERGAFIPEFEAAAFSIAKGEFARAQTNRGLHLITVLDEKMQVKVQSMSVETLFETINNPALAEDVQFVDVREQREWDIAHIPGFKLMPLSEFTEWSNTITDTLDPSKETICLCHHGMRSMQMAQFLTANGFTNVKNVTGGINDYARMDASVGIY